MRRGWRRLKWIAGIILLGVAVLSAPIGYIELACRGDNPVQTQPPIITDARYQRAEANTYLTYPEWHIVYAYEGLAETLKTTDEYGFDYTSSVMGFWNTYCALNKAAQNHGGSDSATRQMLYVIGISFTAEMALKAAYEETIGRFFAAVRGPAKTPEDQVVSAQAADYGVFLHQTPWYKYPFDAARAKLWEAPLAAPARGLERRLGIGAEWTAKSLYASLIERGVAATGEAQLEIRSVVTGLKPSVLQSIPDVKVVESAPDRTIVETPRYARFTEILRDIANRGGTVAEIAGNDDVLVTVIDSGPGPAVPPDGATLLTSVSRDSFGDRRLLLDVKVPRLAAVIKNMGQGRLRLEHVYDY